MYVARTSPRHSHMQYGALRNHLRARIEACRYLRQEAITLEEQEGWLAEEAGLIDALLGVDRTALQRHQGSPSPRERYAVGLHDGQALMMASEAPALRHVNEAQRDRTEKRTVGSSEGHFQPAR